MDKIHIYGAGLAGSEAAWQVARRNCKVVLHEMKPFKKSPAHVSNDFGELVCSNSLRSDELTSGVGLLKEELRRMGSLIMEAAEATKVAAGSALAVDRRLFSEYITNKIKNSKNIEIVYEEVSAINEEQITIIATGPLTSDAMAEAISKRIGGNSLHFYDAAAPIVDFSTINMSRAFFASRYGKGTPDYINCPMNEEEYKAFYNELIHAETAKLHSFESDEKINVFEGCMPVEIMASRGEETLRFGPLKPVGLDNPITGESYYAVVQLRRENDEGSMYNIVGFQTHLTFPEQKRVFRMIPGLEKADFLRYGVMHRNTFLNSPELLDSDYSLRDNKNIFFAGQMTGVEGYIESAASGYVAGVSAVCRSLGINAPDFTNKTMIGAMANYVSRGGNSKFQPMNANFGIIANPEIKIKGGKKPRYEYYANRSLETLKQIDLKLGF